MSFLLDGVMAVTWQQIVMYVVGIVLIWLAVKKEYEPSLLLPMGFGAILVNLPFSGVIDQVVQGKVEAAGIIQWLFESGIEASEAMPILLFIGIGAMIDFGPLLSQPVLFLFGAAAQFGICAAIVIACLMGFDLKDAASIGIIGASGTGIQELTTIIDRLGEGVNNAIGTGGRDLSTAVGGITMMDMIDAMEKDDTVKVLIVISKPPAKEVREKISDRLSNFSKPVITLFLGEKPEYH